MHTISKRVKSFAYRNGNRDQTARLIVMIVAAKVREI